MFHKHIGWKEILHGKKGLYSLILAGGVALHSINVYIVVTILPSLVLEIGGKNYYTWTSTIFVTASLAGASLAIKILNSFGLRFSYICSSLIFSIGTFGCAFSVSMPIFLLSRFIQGFGGGLLISLTYSIVHILFEKSLWPRVIGLISGIWGISSLLGSSIGGVFSQYYNWHLAFFLIGILSATLTSFAFFILPKYNQKSDSNYSIPVMQIIILIIVIFSISIGGSMKQLLGKILGLCIGFLFLYILSIFEKYAKCRILPRNALSPKSVFFSSYFIMIMLITIVNGIELFLPLFLQNLYNIGPLISGYLVALMSVGWTIGALSCAGFSGKKMNALILFSPIFCFIGLLILFIFISGVMISGFFFAVSISLLLIGIGAGIIWPHLLTCILKNAQGKDINLASSSLTSVQLFAIAFSSSITGTITNISGFSNLEEHKVIIDAVKNLFTSFWIFLILILPCIYYIRYDLFYKRTNTEEKRYK